jgi:hypothetical protein
LCYEAEKNDFYRFNDAVNDMICGIADQVVGIFSKVLVIQRLSVDL